MKTVEINDSSMPSRFWSRVSVSDDGCWLWSGALGRDGYGKFSMGPGGCIPVHRAVLLMIGISIPRDLVVDHICRVRNCVNPAHLQIVDRRENALSGVGPSAINAARTKCKRGHDLSGDNVRPRRGRNGRTWRACKACESMSAEEWLLSNPVEVRS